MKKLKFILYSAMAIILMSSCSNRKNCYQENWWKNPIQGVKKFKGTTPF